MFKNYDFRKENPEFFYFVKIFPSPTKEKSELLPIIEIPQSDLNESYQDSEEEEEENKQKSIFSKSSSLLSQGKSHTSPLPSPKDQSIHIDPRSAQMDESLGEFIDIFNRPDDSMITVKKQKDFTMAKIIEDNNPVVLIRGRDTLDFPCEVMFEVLHNIEKRKEWDTVLQELHVVQKIDDSTDVIYNSVKGVMGASPRDFLQMRKYYQDCRGFDYIIVNKSCELEEKPPIKKNVRANCIIGGYLLKKVDQNKTMLGMIMQVDINGYVPKYFVNKFAPGKAIDWFKQFKKYLTAVHK